LKAKRTVRVGSVLKIIVVETSRSLAPKEIANELRNNEWKKREHEMKLPRSFRLIQLECYIIVHARVTKLSSSFR